MTGVWDVYVHTSPSGKQYVGYSAKGWRRRWNDHVHDARRGSTTPLHNAIRKYGPEPFQHAVLDQVTSALDAKQAEMWWIDTLGTRTPSGYNATEGGDGAVISAETRAKLSAALQGRHISDAHRAKLASANTGKRASDSARAKMSAARTGKKRGPMSDEQKQALSRAAKGHTRGKGRILSADTRAKIAASWTPERRAAQALRNRSGHYTTTGDKDASD